MFRKKVLGLSILIVMFLLIVVGGWYIKPTHNLDIIVLNKSVYSNENEIINHRKHYGLFWMLNQLRYRKPDNSKYDYKSDYYKDDNQNSKSFARIGRTPDILHISDTYGDEHNRGLSYEEIASASTAYVNGATLIAESDVFSSTSEESIRGEIESLFGITYTGWAGRYFKDLGDFTDLPEWANTLHETQYGRQWDYSGEGVLLASDSGELIVLEKNKDFNNKMLTISVKDEFENEFRCHTQNFYNWFIIIASEFETQTIAKFNLDLNQSGQEKFKRVSDSTTFPAVVRTQGNLSPAYFFAGDFSDYTGPKRFPSFLFSEKFYQFFTYDRPGDTTSFYWNFYYPLMKTILQKAEANRNSIIQPKANTEAISRISKNRLEVKIHNEWKPFTIKGFNINAVMPGANQYEYTRDISIYSRFISEISAMGGNCIRAYDLLPPEFYRALYQHNRKYPDTAVYFFQSIAAPDNISDADALAEAPLSELRRNVEYIVDAVHGNTVVKDVGSRKGGTYIHDVSPYLIGYIVENDTSAATVSVLNSSYTGFKFTGEYISSQSGAAEGLAALLCDYAYSYQQKNYGYITLSGVSGNPVLAPSLPWSPNSISLDLNSLAVSDKAKPYFFLAYQLQPDDYPVVNDKSRYASYTDQNGSLPYGGYLKTFMKSQTRHPVLIDRFGISTNINAFDQDSTLNGLTEAQQGDSLVRMLRAILNEGCIGGLISDYNDNWYQCSDELTSYVLPAGKSLLWKNPLDPEQNKGVTAVEPLSDGKIGMSVQDTDRMKEIQIKHDSAYIYLSLMLNRNIDYNNEQLIIGLDTYHRNNGEYRYDPAYYATSLSGMEFVIKFESKSSASLYVVPSYNRSKGKFVSKESYTGQYDFIYRLVYGSFGLSGNNFYQAGSTIHIRIPWNLLNFTNPSKHMVINDTRDTARVALDEFGLDTIRTDGIIFSVLIADKKTKDTLYIFPESKQSSGYKTYKWDAWSDVDFVFRQKQSCKIVSDFFYSLK